MCATKKFCGPIMFSSTAYHMRFLPMWIHIMYTGQFPQKCRIATCNKKFKHPLCKNCSNFQQLASIMYTSASHALDRTWYAYTSGGNQAGKCARTLHTFIFAADRVITNGNDKSITTGLFYVCTSFEGNGTLPAEGY